MRAVFVFATLVVVAFGHTKPGALDRLVQHTKEASQEAKHAKFLKAKADWAERRQANHPSVKPSSVTTETPIPPKSAATEMSATKSLDMKKALDEVRKLAKDTHASSKAFLKRASGDLQDASVAVKAAKEAGNVVKQLKDEASHHKLNADAQKKLEGTLKAMESVGETEAAHAKADVVDAKKAVAEVKAEKKVQAKTVQKKVESKAEEKVESSSEKKVKATVEEQAEKKVDEKKVEKKKDLKKDNTENTVAKKVEEAEDAEKKLMDKTAKMNRDNKADRNAVDKLSKIAAKKVKEMQESQKDAMAKTDLKRAQRDMKQAKKDLDLAKRTKESINALEKKLKDGEVKGKATEAMKNTIKQLKAVEKKEEETADSTVRDATSAVNQVKSLVQKKQGKH